MLRRSVRTFVEKEIAPRVTEWEDAGRIPREVWQRLGALGFLGLEFPAEYGGGGADFFASVVIGFWPAIFAMSSTAFSRIFLLPTASPTPMLSVIFSIFGTCIGLVYPKRSISFGTTTSL